MYNVSEAVALIRKQADLEMQLSNGSRAAVSTEGELHITRRRLAAYPCALSAILQTARALHRTPDTVSVREVEEFGGSD